MSHFPFVSGRSGTPGIHFGTLALVLLLAIPHAPAGAQTVSDSDYVSVSSHVVTLPSSGQSFSLTVSIDTKTPNVASFVLPFRYDGYAGLEIDTTVVDSATGNKGISYHSPLGLYVYNRKTGSSGQKRTFW